jgi:hypothetical protein
MAAIVGGWTHGIQTTFKGKNWHEVIEKVPCQFVTRAGDDLKIAAITEEDRIKELEKRCFPKR